MIFQIYVHNIQNYLNFFFIKVNLKFLIKSNLSPIIYDLICYYNYL